MIYSGLARTRTWDRRIMSCRNPYYVGWAPLCRAVSVRLGALGSADLATNFATKFVGAGRHVYALTCGRIGIAPECRVDAYGEVSRRIADRDDSAGVTPKRK